MGKEIGRECRYSSSIFRGPLLFSLRNDFVLMTDRRHAQLVRIVTLKSETCPPSATYDPTIRAIILPSRK
jgi:hypothetical protein